MSARPLIRRAEAGDAAPLTAMMMAASAYDGDYRPMIADYPVTPAMIAANELWLAEDGGEPLAFYSLDIAAADLDLMFVGDAAQGRGLGRMLFSHMMFRARANGLRAVRIVAHPPAAAFYRHMGAVDVGVVAPIGRATWERPLLMLDVAPASFAATVLTLYPEMFPGPLGISLAGRALGEGKWSLDAVQIRDFATDRHRSVDDTPAGGGAGMVMRADVLAAALDSVADDRPKLVMSPRGRPLTQDRVRALAAGPGVTVLCGRFEGIDERLLEARNLEPVSIGDYVLSGGEIGALVLLDACVRLLPGVMGAASSGDEESFESGLLEYPHYTRPFEWEGRTIPEVLRSGDHAKIKAWRKAQAEIATRLRRPDLWERHGGARIQSPSGARHEKEE